RAVVARDGFAGLLPRKRGRPPGAHKLRPDVMAFLTKRRAADPSLSLVALVPLGKNRFGVVVHPRSIELARRRQRKDRPGSPALIPRRRRIAGGPHRGL